MKYPKLLKLAEPYLEENDFGVSHTLRVLEIAKTNYNKYNLDDSWKDTVFSLIILHDIGGSEIKDQYEKGPTIAKELLERLDYHSFDIKLICSLIAQHHEKLVDPHDIFKILFDSDRLVMLSKEEFNNYNSRPDFNWQSIIDSFYHADLKDLAENLLKERRIDN
jgi:hypothetical protein|tara:strand:- start:701 stop:1192 length:492 start_codon:yes stop_codon:yes gene_type:complete